MVKIMEKILMGQEEFAVDGGNVMKLSYFLEREKLNETEYIYGIGICKELHGKKEEEHTGAISCCREQMEALLQLFIKSRVTPMVLLEVTDEVFQERLCS